MGLPGSCATLPNYIRHVLRIDLSHNLFVIWKYLSTITFDKTGCNECCTPFSYKSECNFNLTRNKQDQNYILYGSLLSVQSQVKSKKKSV